MLVCFAALPHHVTLCGIAACCVLPAIRALPHDRIFFSSVAILAQHHFLLLLARLLTQCVCVEEMANTFKRPPEYKAKIDKMFRSNKFVDMHEVELFNPSEQDDTGEDRVIYGFGTTCPLPLTPGIKECRSFKDKLCGCRSAISETASRLHLAKPALDSGNHAAHGNRDQAFADATNALGRTELETMEDRSSYRMQLTRLQRGIAGTFPKTAGARRPTTPPREPEPSRSRSRHRRRRQHAAEPASASDRVLDPDVTLTFPSSTWVSALMKKKKYVKVSIEEMQSLEACLSRSIDSQKRIIESLEFYTRQINDERKVFVEARDVIHSMIASSQTDDAH